MRRDIPGVALSEVAPQGVKNGVCLRTLDTQSVAKRTELAVSLVERKRVATQVIFHRTTVKAVKTAIKNRHRKSHGG